VNLPERLSLARLPTPLQRMDRLSDAWGGPTIWAKRDDLTGFEVSGNKIRKLEFHLAAAKAAGADTLVTCGAIQSNHCRATALAAAPLGLATIVLLRTSDGMPPARSEANHLLMEIAGADIRYVSPDQYAGRDALMAAAMEELAGQLDGLPPMAAIWHAASSGGTTAGMAWGADRLGMEAAVVGCCIGESADAVMDRTEKIWAEAAEASGEAAPSEPPVLIDDYVGLGYGLATPDELAIQAEATRLTGMLLDPTYTGKALVGLRREIDAGRYVPGEHLIFWHTGGGFAAFVEGFQVVR